LRVRGLSKTFLSAPVLDGLDLDVQAGQVLAVLGENGSGKSTFIKILSGYHEPDPGGEIQVGGVDLTFGSAESSHRLGCRFVHQDLGLIPELSVLDNMALGAGYPTRMGTIAGKRARAAAAEDLARLNLDVDLDARIDSLPAARRAGVAIARALRADDQSPVRLLVLDEPTATLPADEVSQLLTLVRSVAVSGVGVIYVTHLLDEVFAVAEKAAILRDGRLVTSRDVTELNHKDLVSLMVGRELEDVHEAAASLVRAPGEPRLEVVGLRAGAARDVSFSVWPGEIVGIAGITGSGRETLLTAMFGGHPRDEGTVRVNGRLVTPGRPDRAIAAGMAFVPPDRKALGAVMDLSARENLTLSSLRSFRTRVGLLALRREKQDTDRWFRTLDVRPAGAFESAFSTFSGGNQQKLLFAKWLRCRPLALLLDGPTEGVDVGARATLHTQLVLAAADGLAVVVTSTDVDELASLCTRVLVLTGGTISSELAGAELTAQNISHRMLSGNQPANAQRAELGR
jgi:ribose transport system ATP-binding protein